MKVLVLDIENTYITAGVWGMYGVNIGIEQLLDNGKILCAAAKWLDDKVIMYKRNEGKEFLTWLHDLLSEADAVLTYNGRRHDLPFINREFLKANMHPPSPYKHIDLLETAKKQFKFPSNKMQHLLGELNLGSKVDHEGFPLWIKCAAGNKRAWETMRKYNINDVRVLEKLYYRLQPWITSHPNRSLWAKDTVCPYCGSKHLQSRGTGEYKTTVGSYRKFSCKDCGGWSRTRYTEITKEERKNIMVPAV